MGESAFGTKLQMGDGEDPEGFDDIAHISNLSGPGLALDTEDVTTHDSTGAWEEVAATILRTGELTAEINYDPTEGTHDATTGLIKKMKDKEMGNYKIVFPGPVTWEFAALVTGVEPGAPADGKLTADVTLKLNGAPTLA